jgi:hypothetical protein
LARRSLGGGGSTRWQKKRGFAARYLPSANNLHIAFGEADPQLAKLHAPRRFPKIFFPSVVSA